MVEYSRSDRPNQVNIPDAPCDILLGVGSADVVVIGAGMVGAACAYYCGAAGLAVTVVERGSVAGGTTGAGEGNVLLSDKEPGPELDLALWSAELWRELADEHGSAFEYEAKGGLVVAAAERELGPLHRFAERQRSVGVVASPVAISLPVSRNWRLTWPVACSIRRMPRCSRCSPPLICCGWLAPGSARPCCSVPRCSVWPGTGCGRVRVSWPPVPS